MTDYLVLNVIADDREGIVEQISQTIINTAATGWKAVWRAWQVSLPAF